MVTLKKGDRVALRSDDSLGIGAVDYVEVIDGAQMATVSWGDGKLAKYNEPQLRLVEDLPAQLGQVNPGSTVSFELRVLGRWFEARHEETGEITNQPFDMLPHQVIVANRVLRSPVAPDGGRHWLIADDVGLGKTIEAGMIEEVMRHRKGGRFRCLIVAPAGLVHQWQVEMAERFGRVFERFRRDEPNKLQTFDQMVASIDLLKRYVEDNEAVLDVHPWDLVIFDEAHHLTKPGVQKYKLARFLRDEQKRRDTLFLTATPHSGNHDHFCNLLNLLRPDLVDQAKGLKHLPDLPLDKLIIRNRKHLVTDAKGDKIFFGIASTTILKYEPTQQEVALAAEVNEYLKHGYNEAGRLKTTDRTAVGFLMSTFGKLASSSREALKAALERRLEVLHGTKGSVDDGNGETQDEDATGAVGVAIPRGKEGLIRGELNLVERLLARVDALPRADSKLEGFVSGLHGLVQATPDLKVLIFTEYRATQDVLTARLADLFGEESVATIHGSKSLDERKEIVARFNEQDQPRFIVSTAAGGEGINLQRRCHTIVNYDLPWNPNVLQQRIGRVYRYGQTKPVIVYNLKVETDSEAFVDNKVYQYLTRKLNDVVAALAKATGEGPEDLLDDVLGQAAEQGLSLEQLHQMAIEEGRKKVEEEIDKKADDLEKIMKDKEMTSLFSGLSRFNLEDYHKVQSRVTSEHLEFFVRQYCENQQLGFRVIGEKRFSFKPSHTLVKLAEEQQENDPYALAGRIPPEKVPNATVDREVAQKGGRLLRFGDPVFEAMVHHVQYSCFSQVASLDLSSEHLGWQKQQQGTWQVFELRVTRTEGARSFVLRRELACFVVPVGGDGAESKPELIEHLTEATQGPSRVDVDEARRALRIARLAADARHRELVEEVRGQYTEYRDNDAILPEGVSEFALAWIRAV